MKIIILCGPTGVGKSEVALRLAEAIGGEIVVADSQAVLKGFDIGTAKPTTEERACVPHHLIDVVEFGEIFDAATFVRMADEAIVQIYFRNKIPIVSGGTGLYLKALLYGMMEAPHRDENFRRHLEERVKAEGLNRLYEELKTIDPKRASEIHRNDALRIIRALEIAHRSGHPPSTLAQTHGFKERRYEALKIGFQLPRDELNERIDQRVLTMLNRGWLKEVRGLLEKGIDLIHGRTQTIGYPILARHVKGEIFIKEAIETVQQETRRLAKRQMTWFRADPEIKWFHPNQWEAILYEVKSFLLTPDS